MFKKFQNLLQKFPLLNFLGNKYYLKAKNLFNLGDYKKAKEIIYEVIKYYKNYDTLYLIALINLKIEDYTQLEEVIYEIIDIYGLDDKLQNDFSDFFNTI